MLTEIAFAIVNGLTTGMAVFLVAAGLTLVFGILKILNFAHGSFFMIGAYVAFSIVGDTSASLATYLGASMAGALVVGVLGWIADLTVLRRLRHYEEALTLIATFALLLFADGMVKLVWGTEFHSVNPPARLSGSFQVGALTVPAYSLFIIFLGVAVYAALDLVIHRLWVGKLVQALAHDAWMSRLVGIDAPLLFTGAVIAAFALAGLAGGLLLPNQSLSPVLSQTYMLHAFVVIIIGGLGNVRGAFLAAILLALVESLNSVVLPQQPGIAIYVAMVGFLLWRPQGLLQMPGGGRAGHGMSALGSGVAFSPSPSTRWLIAALASAAFLSVPLWADQGLLFVAGILLIDALFALSWNLLFGYAGLASFGHAAFFAVGAYAAGWMSKTMAGWPFLLVLLLASVGGGLLALVVGALAIRRTAGIALAILTMALCEILRISISASRALGMDDGLSGIPRPSLGFGLFEVSLRTASAYYWFLCVAFLVVSLAMWWLMLGRFGRVLRAIRQDAERAEFLGIRIGRYRVLAFAVSGAVATLAGALLAPWTQIVTPDTAGALRSLQPMLSTLLGGAEFFWGPAVGAVLFAAISYATRTLAGVSEVVSGLTLLVIVLAAPAGVLGIFARLRARTASASEGAEAAPAFEAGRRGA